MRGLQRARYGGYESFDRIVIVGAGRAGTAAAEELRIQGFAGEISIICDELEAPYDRPSCSKGILTGHQRPKDTKMPMADGTDLIWRLGRRAVQLDTRRRVVHTDDGDSHDYDGLIIASGSRAVFPKGWPAGEPGLHVLYSLADAWGLRKDLWGARKVVVVGGGLTGCETAYAVRSLAREAMLIDRNPQVMTRAIGEPVGALVTDELRKDGVQLRLGRKVTDVTRRRGGWHLVLDDGEDIYTDVVVITAGERPNTEWLASAPELDTSNGVLCDSSLRVVNAEGIVAAGTVARWPNLRYDSTPGRCGQWIAAYEQGRAAAQALLADDRPVAPCIPVPRFWSQQYGLRIQVCGTLPSDAEVTMTALRPGRSDVARAGVLASYLRDGQVMGLVAVNAPHAFMAVSRTMLSARPQLVEEEIPEPAYEEEYQQMARVVNLR